MSTILKSQTNNESKLPKLSSLRVGIVVAEWNSHITYALLSGARKVFNEEGYDRVDVFHVPGAVELTFAASRLINEKKYDAVIVFGCVIRGDTPHFDYVCQSVTQGITHLNTLYATPVIFGVLTVENEQQALDRAGGVLGNKGSEAAETAIKMCDFALNFK